MRGRSLVAVVVVLGGLAATEACGRSPLDDTSFTFVSGGDAGAPLDASVADAAPPLDAAGDDGAPAIDAAPPDGDCPSALAAGAPTPMAGECSTRDGRSVVSLPLAPQVAWTSVAFTGKLDVGGHKEPSQLAVDATGRVIVTYDLNPGDTAIPQAILRFAPKSPTPLGPPTASDGPLEGTPLFRADGAFLVWHPSPEPRVLAWDPATLAITESIVVPSGLRADPAIDAAGALYFVIDDLESPARVMKLVGESVAWTSAPLASAPSRLALGRDGRVILAFTDTLTTTVLALEPASGQIAWQLGLDGYGVDGPLVQHDGAIAISLARNQLTLASLAVLEPAGTVRHQVDLGVMPQPAGSAMAVAADGTVILRAWDRTFAIDATGQIRWQRMTHPNLEYGLVIGADDRLLLTSGNYTALDVATGVEVWHVDPPNPNACAGAAALAPNGFYAAQCDGTIFYASGQAP